jgi:hypothetical protein
MFAISTDKFMVHSSCFGADFIRRYDVLVKFKDMFKSADGMVTKVC